MLYGYPDRRVEVDGVSLADTDAGDGPPLLLLHGAWDDRHVWSPLLPEFSADYRVIAPDTRGHGLSPDPDGPWTYEAFADDWIALIQALDLGPVRTIGHSDGACTALIVALRRPDLVEALVLMGCPVSAAVYSPEAMAFLAAITPTSLASLGIDIAATIRRAIDAYPDPSDYDRFFFGLRRTNQLGLTMETSALNQITPPALVLHGEHEGFFGRQHSRALAGTLARGRFELVQAAGHGLPLENPKRVGELIRVFLTSL